MPWYIRSKGGKHCVIRGRRGQDGGETVDCHPSLAQAKARLAALYAAEPGAAEMAAKTVTIYDVELLPPGTWNGQPISRRDIEGIAEAFEEVGDALPIPLQLGHDARQAFASVLVKAGILTADDAEAAAGDDGEGGASGWPGIGKIGALSVRPKDGMLLGRFVDVPQQLAAWIKGGAYANRSVTLWPRKVIGGKVYHWWLHNVALLGDTPPAVDGLAPALGLAGGLPDDAVVVTFSVGDADPLLALADGEPGSESALDRLVNGLSAQFDEYAPLVYGRKGAPAARTLFAAFLAKLRESARPELPLSTGGNSMELTLDALRGVLSLAVDADASAIVAALNAAPPDVAGKVVTLAVGTPPAAGGSFQTADQLVGWLAGALGVAPGDLDGVAAKIVALMGGGTSEAEANAEGSTTEVGMGATNTVANAATPTATPVTAQMVEMAAAYTSLVDRTTKVERELALSKAAAKVDADAKARNLALPVPVRDVLIELSVSGNQAAYAAVLGNTVGVPVGERGSAEEPDGPALTLSATDKMVARQIGISEADMLAQKAADAGIQLPAPAGAPDGK